MHMYKDQKILCIIPARGGSKRLPGKNIKSLNGIPLIGYAIRAAKGSRYVDKIIVSTDDEEIAHVAKEQGAEVPFMRPTELATDTATTLAVLQHAVKYLNDAGEKFNIIVLIQPTVPGVESIDVDVAIEKLVDSGSSSCISICEINDRPEFMYRLSGEGMITRYNNTHVGRTQDMEPLYRVNGAVYATAHDTLMKDNLIIDNTSCAGVLMPRERSIDIDSALDFTLAEQLLKSETDAS